MSQQHRVRLAGQGIVAVVVAGLAAGLTLVAVARGSSDAPSDSLAPGSAEVPDGLGRISQRQRASGITPRATTAPAPIDFSLRTVKGEVTWASGAFSGGTLESNKAFGAWRNRPIKTSLYFADQSSWEAIENPEFLAKEFAKDRSVLPVISYALFPPSERGGITDPKADPRKIGGAVLPLGARGDFDEHWRTLARNLVAQGLPNAVIRPGWEFNGTWYRWSAGTDAAARAYAGYFRHIVTAMRSVPGARFTFSWCPVQFDGGIDLRKAYPGDDFVDDIGFDVYNSLMKPRADPDEQWERIRNIKYGLQWQLDFAKERGKPLSYPEWGGFADTINPDRAGGDDPVFIRGMFAWMVAHPPKYENYFDYDTDYGVHYGLSTPASLLSRSAQTYRLYWGQTPR